MYRILIVDDEKTIRETLPKVIPWQEHGFMVAGTAQNGVEALDFVKNNPVELILLDVRMPLMDGIAFLKAFREEAQMNTQVIMLSGYSDFSYARDAMRYGVQAYLTKPIDEEELYQVLESVRGKLAVDDRSKTLIKLQRDVEILRTALDGAPLDPTLFEDYFLLTAIMMPYSHNADESASSGVMRSIMAQLLLDHGMGLVWIRGYANLYLIRKSVMAQYEDRQAFASAILHGFMAQKVDCAVLFDLEALLEPAFAPAYKDHLHLMETTLFYDARHDVNYDPGTQTQTEQFQWDYVALKEALNQKEEAHWQQWFANLIKAMRLNRVAYSLLQEISNRLYYTAFDALKLGSEASPLPRTVLREEPYFLRSTMWENRMGEMLSLTHRDLLLKREMQGMGITGDIVTYIRQRYMEPLTIKQVAEKFFLNPVYLGQVFRKSTGLSFKQYLNDIRINAAKELLIETDLKIYEVAQRVGYPESKYFIVKFEESLGISPSEFRKKV